MAATSERAPFRQTAASVALDAMRGIAALLVLLDHCHNLFSPSSARPCEHPHITYLLYALSSAGAEAVVLFFMLSGYLISGSVLRSLQQGRWNWKDYLTHRLVRLWLVLIPALVLCAMWDISRLAYTGVLSPGGAGLSALLGAENMTPKTFAGNVLFVQQIYVHTFGSDRVLWSLAAEFWYYMLFPLGLLALRKETTMGMRVVYGLGFFGVAAFAGRAVVGLFPVWLCGAVLAMVAAPKIGWGIRWLTSLLYAPWVFFFAMTPWHWRYIKMDYILGGLTMGFLWVMLSARQKVDERMWVVKASRSLAGISYSLYLVHYPFLAFLAAVSVGMGKWPAAPVYLLAGLAVCVLAILYSYGVAACTEWHNERVRQWVEARLAGAVPVHQTMATR
jgi:peptidoglycan/LPS O-acetylase OafA/YrhL